MKAINKNTTNVMKKLNVSQMENLQGGLNRDCALAIAGLGLTIAGAFITTTPVGGALLVGSMIVSGMSMSSCKH
ncbi:hypothetical protein KCF3NO3_03520 [Chryseobacterium sp. KCF3-3]